MDRLYKLRNQGYVEINGEIWFANLDFNALVKINKASGRIQIIDKFPNFDIMSGWLYATVCYVDEQLVFVPLGSDEIVTYDLREKEFVSVALDKGKIGNKKGYFANAYVSGNYVYMFPAGAKCIVKYDVTGQKIDYLTNCLNAVENVFTSDDFYFYQEFEVVDEKIYIPFLGLNAIGIFDIRDENMEIKYLDIDGGCSTIIFIGGYFYLASTKAKKIYRWDAKTGEIHMYDIFPQEFIGGEEGYLFIGGCKIMDGLFLFPAFGNMIIFFEPDSGKICEIQRIDDGDRRNLHTYFVNKKENYILMKNMEVMCSFYYEEGRLSSYPYCYMDDSYNKREINRFLRKYACQDTLMEGGVMLDQYIEMVAENDILEETEKGSIYGKEIFLGLANDKRVRGKLWS